MDLNLSNKKALVTGAGRGLGQEIGLALAAEGADVALVDLELTEDAEVRLEELGVKGLAVTADVTDEDQMTEVFKWVATEFGGLDILVNNAGISQLNHVPTTVSDIDEWDRVLAVNLRGTFLCCREAARTMIDQGGAIVNIASTAGITGVPRAPAYCASKSGVIGLTKSLALEWAESGIRVNAVAPHYLVTDLTEGLRGSERVYGSLTRQIPLGRFGEPGEVARAVLFLASEASAYSTGTVLEVDGGYLAR